MAKGGRRLGSGRRRKATELKVVQGTFRADRHGDEPVVPSKWPDPPAHLTAEQRELWTLYQDTHGGLGVAASDWPAINGVVAITGLILRNQRAQEETDTAGHPLAFVHALQERDGQSVEFVTAKENPLISQSLKLWRELRAYIAITGRSPVDRARLSKGDAAPPLNPFDAFMKKHKA